MIEQNNNPQAVIITLMAFSQQTRQSLNFSREVLKINNLERELFDRHANRLIMLTDRLNDIEKRIDHLLKDFIRTDDGITA